MLKSLTILDTFAQGHVATKVNANIKFYFEEQDRERQAAKDAGCPDWDAFGSSGYVLPEYFG